MWLILNKLTVFLLYVCMNEFLTFIGCMAQPQSDRGIWCRRGHQDLWVLGVDGIHSTNWSCMALTLNFLYELETEHCILGDTYNRRSRTLSQKHCFRTKRGLTFSFCASQTMIWLSEAPETRWSSGATEISTQLNKDTLRLKDRF